MGQPLCPDNPKPFYLKKVIKAFWKTRKVNMSNWVDILADIYSERKFIFLEREIDYGFFKGDAINYFNAIEFINRIGNSLKEIGVKRGDRVCVITMNRIELAFAYYAIMKIGAIVVPLNAMFRAPEIRYVVENCGAEVLITDRAVFQGAIKDTSLIPSVKKWIMLTRREVPEGFLSLSEMMASASPSLDPIELKPDDVVAILYTSGTTGFPKGAMLTNEAFSRQVRYFTRLFSLFPTFNRYSGVYVVPLAHVMGYVIMLMAFCSAFPTLFMSSFNPDDVLSYLEKYNGMVFMGVPTMYAMMSMCNPRRYDLSSMKVWASAADALPREYLGEFRQYGGFHIFGRKVLPSVFAEGYGQVEVAGLTTILVHFLRKSPEPGCVGKPVRETEVRIVDPETLKDVKRGEPGELLVKTPRMLKGYWGDEELNRKSFVSGWFRTGDILRMGNDGRLYFVDREKDMIKVSGYSVFSKEVEEEMMKHMKIAECAIIGAKDKVKGTKPIAIVKLKQGEKADESELVAWAKENIAPYKAPRRVIIVEEMPYGMTMKIDKKVLRKEYENILLEDEKTF